VKFPIRTVVCNIPRLPNLQTTVEEGNLSKPIHTSHNSHTHTDHTRQSEPQLKECLCSSAILSHNSRNATCLPSIPSHNSRDTVPSHNSRNTPASRSLRYYTKPCRPRTSKEISHKSCLCFITWHCSRASRRISFQTGWWSTYVTRR